MSVAFQGSLRALARRKEQAEHPGQVPGRLLWRGGSRQGSGDLRGDLDPGSHEAIIERALAGLNPMGSQYRKLSRFYQGNSFEVELDGSGRVTLPPPLLAHAAIEKEVVVVGVGDHLEVWGRERWGSEQRSLDSEIEEVTERLGHPS
jgi:hypothetical protein